jgi:hypothetical protein
MKAPTNNLKVEATPVPIKMLHWEYCIHYKLYDNLLRTLPKRGQEFPVVVAGRRVIDGSLICAIAKKLGYTHVYAVNAIGKKYPEKSILLWWLYKCH